MTQLSMWWKQEPVRGYVARRVLISPKRKIVTAPFSHLEVYYCGAGFTTLCVPAASRPISSYLVTGEKEPIDEEADSPWTRKRALEMMGGVLRLDVPEIIPVLYVTIGFAGQKDGVELSSDTVPLARNAHYTIRVISGQFEQISYFPFTQAPHVTLWDVVLNQGGEFSWEVPAGHQVYVYVMGGRVSFGPRDQLAGCPADTLISVTGRTLYATAQCAGGRFIVIAAKHKGVIPTTRAGYEQLALPKLDQVES